VGSTDDSFGGTNNSNNINKLNKNGEIMYIYRVGSALSGDSIHTHTKEERKSTHTYIYNNIDR